jgi:hypothetical protein
MEGQDREGQDREGQDREGRESIPVSFQHIQGRYGELLDKLRSQNR